MTSFRYASSFTISAIVYSALTFLFVHFVDAKKPLPKPKEKVIKIAVIKLPPPPAPKIIVPPAPTPIIVPPVIIPPKKVEKAKPKKRIVKKKIVKKKVIKKKIIKKKIVKKKVIEKPKPKKIVKKPIIKKTAIQTKPIIQEAPPIVREPEPIIEEFYEVYTPPKPIARAVPPPQPVYKAPIYVEPPAPIPVQKVDNSAEKRAFLSQVRTQIINNKKYPKLALRRHIEGSVRVKFDISSNGDVSNIRFVSGKSILQKAVRKAVLNSFPISIPQNLSEELPINNISVTVNFNIN